LIAKNPDFGHSRVRVLIGNSSPKPTQTENHTMTSDTKLRIELFPTEAKRLELGIDDNRSSLTYEFSSLEASHVAARILQTAKRAYELSGEPKPDITARPTTWAIVQTSALGLAPSEIPNHESILLQFGDAVLAIPIDKTKLCQFVELILALRADSPLS
jgi:hypothetical protein